MDEAASESTKLSHHQQTPSDTVISSGLTIKIAATSCCRKPGNKGTWAPSTAVNSEAPSPNLKNSIESSPYNSPSLVSPPSSAFVSALQSPYISPRAVTPSPSPPPQNPTPLPTHPSPPLSFRGSQSDAMILIRGRRKKDYPAEELDFLKKFDEKLGRLSFGLWLVGSLLSELAITPSALYEAINQLQLDESSPCSFISIDEEQYCKNNPFLIKVLTFCFAVLQQTNGRINRLASRMLLVGAWFAPSPISASLLGTAAENMPAAGNRFRQWTKCLGMSLVCCSSCLSSQNWKSEEDSALLLVKLGLARRANKQGGCWIQFHPITQVYGKRNQGLQAAKATVYGIRKTGNPSVNSDHLWASAFLVFGFKSEPPLVQLKAIDMVLYIKRTALPLAIRAFTTFSRCNSALELLKVCTNVLEEVEKSFVSQIQDWCHGSLCWKNKLKGNNQRVDEYVWQDVTLLKATLLETRAKLLLRGGHFDSGEELCRTCISIRTVMLGHNHAQTLAAQETLAKLVRMRSKI